MPTNAEIAARLAAKLGGRLAEELTARKEAVVAGLPVLARVPVRMCWGQIVGQVPVVGEAGVEAVLDEFGGLSVHDLLAFLADHAIRTGNVERAKEFRHASASKPG